MSTTIDGKAILVTGANRGIGQALSRPGQGCGVLHRDHQYKPVR